MESSKIPLIMYLKKKHLPSGRKEKNRRGADGFLCAKKHLIHGGSIRAAVFLCADSSHGGIKGGCRHDAPDAVTA